MRKYARNRVFADIYLLTNVEIITIYFSLKKIYIVILFFTELGSRLE